MVSYSKYDLCNYKLLFFLSLMATDHQLNKFSTKCIVIVWYIYILSSYLNAKNFQVLFLDNNNISSCCCFCCSSYSFVYFIYLFFSSPVSSIIWIFIYFSIISCLSNNIIYVKVISNFDFQLMVKRKEETKWQKK